MLRWLSKRPQSVSRSHVQTLKLSTSRHKHRATATDQDNENSIERDNRIQALGPQQANYVRHLLRALLRECTYLPDAFARQWMSQYILSRFRSYTFKAWQNEQQSIDGFEKRLKAKELEARKGLSQLKRANAGERKCLLKVLLMAYGRVGKRRHELMRPLLPLRGRSDVQVPQEHEEDNVQSDEVVEVASDEMEHDLDSMAEENATHLFQTASRTLDLTPQLRALLISQIRNSPPSLTRANPRRLQPEIPELNSWLRPMPQKRIKNMKKKHYAYLLDRVHPPLPKDEWFRLRDLASGRTKIPNNLQPPRRKSAGSEDDGSPWLARTALEQVVKYGKVPDRAFENQKAHDITPRFMQRLYAQVFSQCPLMELEDAATNRWKVTWGEQALAVVSSRPMVRAIDVKSTETSSVQASASSG